MKRLLIAIPVALLLAVTVTAAENPQAPAGSTSDPVAANTGLISLDFPGGTVAQYIDAVRKASNDANIVVIGDVTPIQMPAVRLKNVDTWAAVNIINQLPQQQKDLLVNIGAALTSDEPDQERVYTVSAQVTRMGSLGASVESTVMTVADVVQSEITADDLLTAVKLAVEVVGMADEPADIKFHKETGLLIAKGSSDQIAAIHSVVEQLREQVKRSFEGALMRQRIDPSDRASAFQEATNAVNELRLQVQEKDALIQQMQTRLTQLEAQVKQGKQP